MRDILYNNLMRTEMSLLIKAVIFDFDGTLANTLLDISVAANKALESNGFAARETEEYKMFVGNGIPKMLKRASGYCEDEEKLKKLEFEFFEYYNVHYCDKTAAYDGIAELLSDVKALGLKTAVVTNKEDKVANIIVNKLFPNVFDMVCGNKEGFLPKPDPTLTLWVMDKLGVKPSECIFLGDSGVDVSTGVNSGAVAVGETWGFRDEEELRKNNAQYIIHTPAELINIIKNINAKGD